MAMLAESSTPSSAWTPTPTRHTACLLDRPRPGDRAVTVQPIRAAMRRLLAWAVRATRRAAAGLGGGGHPLPRRRAGPRAADRRAAGHRGRPAARAAGGRAASPIRPTRAAPPATRSGRRHRRTAAQDGDREALRILLVARAPR